MDKQKQIEELTNIIMTIQTIYHEKASSEQIAQGLVNANCRIVGQGSVVLTEEEWANLHEDYAKALYEKDKQSRKETAKEICEMGENLYKMSYHKSNAMPRLVAWIKSNFGVEIKE